MQKVEITLAIPVYNAEKYIEKSLKSALKQDFKDYEILIIDNKSTDSTLEMIEDIKKELDFSNIIKVIKHEKNKGLGASKNTAINSANGRYLFFMDSDDYIEPNTLSVLYENIIKYNAEIAIGSLIYEDENGNILRRILCDNIYIESNYAYLEKEGFFYWMTWNKLYDINFLKYNKIDCIPHHLHEDLWFTFQVAAYASKVVYIKEETYHYINNSSSICNQHKVWTEKNINEHIEILEKEYETISSIDKFNYLKVRRLYSNLFINTSYFIFQSKSSNKKWYLKRLSTIKPNIWHDPDLRYTLFLITMNLFSYKLAIYIDYYIINKLRIYVRKIKKNIQ